MRDGCPLCGAERGAPMFDKAGLRYRRCRVCGLQYASAHANANFRATIDDYEPAYRQYLDESTVDAVNLDDTIAWMELSIDLNSRSLRVLDVGAGSGKFVRRLRRSRQCEVTGLEPSRSLFDTYDLGSLGVVCDTAPGFAAHALPFDVVTAFDVIEHVQEAGEFVRALGRLTKPEGHVFLSTPDAAGWLARLLGRRWHHYNAYHFSMYGPATLSAAATISGFDMISSQHRPKRMPLGYLWNYGLDFLIGRRRSVGHRTDGFSVDVNLRDILSVVWRKTG